MPWSIVNFQRVYSIKKELLVEHTQSINQRLRLQPPYREHFSQAFARFFMRVGLPHDLRSFESEGS